MKPEQLNKLFDATGEISENYIAEALPKSKRGAHSAAEAAVIRQEEQTMKTNSIMHHIVTGFAAAAAIGVVVAGGLLIKNLNSRNERVPGSSGSSALELVSATADPAQTTVSAPESTTALNAESTTAQTAESTTALTAESTTTLSAEQPNGPEGRYGKLLNDDRRQCYFNEKNDLQIVYNRESIITEKGYSYACRENGADYTLYRRADNQDILTITNAAQYLGREMKDGEKLYCNFRNITDAGSGWYFVTAEVGTYTELLDNYPCPIINEQVSFWTNPATGQKQRIVFADDPELKQYTDVIWLLPYFTQADPDGGAVYSIDRSESKIYRIGIPDDNAETMTVPDGKHSTACLSGHSTSQYAFINMAPLKGGKVLSVGGKEENGFWHMPLQIIDIKTGSVVKELQKDSTLYSFFSHNGRILALTDSTLVEYDPDTNTTRTISEKLNVAIDFLAFWDDAVAVDYYLDYDPETEQHNPMLISLKDGSVTEIK